MDEAAMSDERGERLVWSVEETGRLLGISRAHAYELVARGELPHLAAGPAGRGAEAHDRGAPRQRRHNRVTDADAGVIVALGPDGTALLVTESSLSFRQAIGPVAWSALELLALSGQLDARGALVVTVGVRELAAQLGVGRDATANALSHLRELGLISASQQRAGRGRFDGTRHTILLPLLTEPSRSARTRSAKTARRDAHREQRQRRHCHCSTTRPTRPPTRRPRT